VCRVRSNNNNTHSSFPELPAKKQEETTIAILSSSASFPANAEGLLA
jgi:hypothetical protein